MKENYTFLRFKRNSLWEWHCIFYIYSLLRFAFVVDDDDACLFEAGLSVAQASLKLTRQPKLSLNSWFSCLPLLSAESSGVHHHITGVHHHIWTWIFWVSGTAGFSHLFLELVCCNDCFCCSLWRNSASDRYTAEEETPLKALLYHGQLNHIGRLWPQLPGGEFWRIRMSYGEVWPGYPKPELLKSWYI